MALAVCLFAPAVAAGEKRKAPKEWDERVQAFVDFVEEARDLEFDRPVKVRFPSDKRFEAELRADYEELTEKDKALDQQFAGELVALGLAAEVVDLSQASEDLDAEGTVGFYDTEVEELVVRGTDADSVGARVTIVHELTHALQDQQFDLDALYKRAKEGSEALALDFLVEGDATTVENAYLETLSPEEQDEYFGTFEDIAEEPLPQGVPYALEIFSAAPYVLGESYVFALDPDGGTKGRDRAFEKPPTTEEVLIDPVALERRQRAKKVATPELEQGEKEKYDPEQFGVLTLYLMLATRLEPRTALEAVTGWGGDRYVGFEREGKACVRVNITGDRAKDTDELEAALTAWQATLPAGAVVVARSTDVVTFTACAAEGVTEPSVETFDQVFYNVLGSRIFVVVDLASSGLPLGSALCVGDEVSTDPEVTALYDLLFAEGRDPSEAEQAVIDEGYEEGFAACGVDIPGA